MADADVAEGLTSTGDSSSAETDAIDLDEALRRAIRGGPAVTDAHLLLLERDIVVGETRTNLHCYFLPLDGNGRVRFKPLAEFLRDRIVDYAIPRRAIEEAKLQMGKTGSMAPIAKLHAQARGVFTHLVQSGEGGELLLFAMAEAVFGLTQILCKMSLKTSAPMHYHGADGVYANARSDGGLNIYWGESKIYGDAAAAIRDCLESLAPYLIEPEGEDALRQRDLLLVNEFANFTDQALVDALRSFLDKDTVKSLSVRQCGISLVAFDCASYPDESAATTLEKLEKEIRGHLPSWLKNVERRVGHEKLENFDIHFICIPLHSADAFRAYFLHCCLN
jgi:Cap4 SAVED domain